MKMQDAMKAMAIVAKYGNPEKDWLHAEHDIIYLPIQSDRDMSAEDRAELERLGAFIDEDTESWAFYT